MAEPENVVSVNPYFKVKPGKMDAFKAALPAFIEKVATEPGNLYYEFTINGDVVYCREAYAGAKGFLAHLELVGAMLPGLLEISDVIRLEVHGPVEELEQLKAPLADMKPEYFVSYTKVKR